MTWKWSMLYRCSNSCSKASETKIMFQAANMKRWPHPLRLVLRIFLKVWILGKLKPCTQAYKAFQQNIGKNTWWKYTSSKCKSKCTCRCFKKRTLSSRPMLQDMSACAERMLSRATQQILTTWRFKDKWKWWEMDWEQLHKRSMATKWSNKKWSNIKISSWNKIELRKSKICIISIWSKH